MVEEQEKKYLDVMEAHQELKQDFESEKSRKKLKYIEELIREVYQNQ